MDLAKASDGVRGGPWMTRSPESVVMLDDLKEAGCDAFGEDSHWVEEREWTFH
jgi:hypothetical protein